MSKAKALFSFAVTLGLGTAQLPVYAAPQQTQETPAPKLLRLGGNVAAANIVTQVKPVYPPEAKAAGVQGTVRLEARIGTDGHVATLNVLSGPPELVPSAIEAVSKWVYRPTLLNGTPVEVATTVDVNYTLAP